MHEKEQSTRKEIIEAETNRIYINGRIDLQTGVINMKRKIELFLSHVESICGSDGKLYQITDEHEHPQVVVVSYNDIPEANCTTAFSYGLSSIAHPQWVAGRPELVISVNSNDNSWSIAMGEIIRTGRREHLFERMFRTYSDVEPGITY